jgi:hypothetical protein
VPFRLEALITQKHRHFDDRPRGLLLHLRSCTGQQNPEWSLDGALELGTERSTKRRVLNTALERSHGRVYPQHLEGSILSKCDPSLQMCNVQLGDVLEEANAPKQTNSRPSNNSFTRNARA